jgi:Flp pilus assembly protein TadG
MTVPRGDMSQYWSDDRGAAAVEFALVAPCVVMLLVGIMSLSLMMLSIGSMHFAAEPPARCASAMPTVCSSQATIVAYANSSYLGAVITPTFTYTVAACGNQVSATATYTLDVGMFQRSIPLSATSCFP